MLSASLAQLDLAWVARLASSAEFEALVGLDPAGVLRLKFGWPKALLEKPLAQSLPLVTWEVLDRSPTGETPPSIRIVSNVWVWPHSLDGGLDRLNAIDVVMCDLLGGREATAWLDAVQDVQVDCMRVECSDPVSALIRRRSVWEVSPAA